MDIRQKITFCVVFLFFISPARADYHYASHEGSDEYPYTSWETGAHRIQDAVNAAGSGDTIYVASGTWPDTVEIWTNSLALIGMGMDSAIWENYYITQLNIHSDTVLVRGFSFISDWENHANTSGIGVRSFGFVVITENYFSGNGIGIAGENIAGNIYNNILERNRNAFATVRIKDELIISNNTVINDGPGRSINCDDLYSDTSSLIIRNNLFYAGDQQAHVFDGISFYGPDSAFIHNNVAYKKIDVAGASHASFGYSGQQTHYYNNTIDGRSEGTQFSRITGIDSNVWGDDTTVTIDNNIVSYCDLGIYNSREIPARVRYCDFFEVDTYFDGPGEFLEGNIFDDPMFMDTLDYHLQAFSPAINAGDPEVLDPDGSRSDMGAYGGPYGESYEYYDLPPRNPDSLRAEVSQEMDTIFIFWRMNTEVDFNCYRVHRDTVSGFEPTVFNMIAEPETSSYVDTDFDLVHSYYYRIAAVDNQDNTSDYSEELGVIFTGIEDEFDPNLPRSAVLHQNYPNPFNHRTIIKYYLPDIGYQPAEIRLEVYDILGRVVRILVNERQYPGEYSVGWDGRNERREDLPSGVYFCRLWVSKAEFSAPKKIVLIR